MHVSRQNIQRNQTKTMQFSTGSVCSEAVRSICTTNDWNAANEKYHGDGVG